MTFPCLQPNQPDPNVLTEVTAMSGFPALESTSPAAYIGGIAYEGDDITGTSGHTEGPFPENYESTSKIRKHFIENRRKRGNVACILADVIFRLIFFAGFPPASQQQLIL